MVWRLTEQTCLELLFLCIVYNGELGQYEVRITPIGLLELQGAAAAIGSFLQSS